MARRITITIGLVATLVGVELAVRRGDSQLSEYYMGRLTRKQVRLASLESPPDVVIIGSSRAAYGFSPGAFDAVLGCRTFNLGICGAKVREWERALRVALKRGRPALIVLGINAAALRDDDAPIFAEWSARDSLDFVEYTLTHGWSNDLGGQFLEYEIGRGCATVRRWFEIRCWVQEQSGAVFPLYAEYARQRRERVRREARPDGWEHPWLFQKQPRNLVEKLAAVGDSAVYQTRVPTFNPDAPAIDELDRLLGVLRSSGSAVIVCYLPDSPRAQRRWRGVEPRMKRVIADACNRHGIEYFDTSCIGIERKDADYADEAHFGLPLADTISRAVAHRLLADGLIDRAIPEVHSVKVADRSVP